MKNVVITGISRGIGRALVKDYLDRGYRCIGITRGLDSKNEGLSHENLFIVKTDWDDFDAISIKVKSLLGESEGVDILINNAATINVESLLDATQPQFDFLMKVNTSNPFMLSQSMLKSGCFVPKAHIVNISSMAGYQDSSKFQGLGFYSASKAALACLSQCMAHEWSEYLAVNCLCLGAVNTDMLNEAFPDYVAPISDVEMAKFISDFSISASKTMSGQVVSVKISDPG